MHRTYTNSLAAFAAVFLAIASIGAVVTVPPAQAQGLPVSGAMIELA